LYESQDLFQKQNTEKGKSKVYIFLGTDAFKK